MAVCELILHSDIELKNRIHCDGDGDGDDCGQVDMGVSRRPGEDAVSVDRFGNDGSQSASGSEYPVLSYRPFHNDEKVAAGWPVSHPPQWPYPVLKFNFSEYGCLFFFGVTEVVEEEVEEGRNDYRFVTITNQLIVQGLSPPVKTDRISKKRYDRKLRTRSSCTRI